MQLFSNNADASLNGAIVSDTTAIVLKDGEGSKFPSPAAGDYFLVTIFDRLGTTELNHEIVKCTSRIGDVLTVTRAQEGTSAKNFPNGACVELRVTAGTLNNKVEKVEGKSLSTEDFTTPEKTKLGGIASGATANSSDAFLKNRANHTGTQAIQTIEGLDSVLGTKVSDAPSDGKTYGRKDAAWAEIAAAGGAVDYLGTVTANGAASADITGLETLGATYDRMFIVADAVNLNPSSGPEIRAFFQMGGSWPNSNYAYSTETRLSTAEPASAQSNTGGFIPICSAAAGGSLSPGSFGTQILVNIHRTTGAGGRIDWQSLGLNSSLAFNAVQGVAQRSSSTQGLQGIRFAPSTGTMFGVFRLYGIRKS